MEPSNMFAPHPKENEPWDVAVIGSGPAGLTAAIYTTRGASSTIIIGGSKWGGQLMLTNVVDNFPGFPDGIEGPELMSNMRKQAEKFGAKFLAQDLTSLNLTKTPFELIVGSDKYLAKSIILATGAQINWLEVEGERELIGRGVSSCAPCDAPFFKGKTVAVVGGGDSAMEETLVLSKYAKKIYLIHRRDAFKASAIMQKKVLSLPMVEVLWNTEVTKVIGDSKLEKLTLKNSKDNSVKDLSVDGLFVAIGHKPSTENFQGHVDLDEKGYIKKLHNFNSVEHETGGYQMGTSVPGVFVAGDVHDYHYKQAITAAGLGCMAGMDAIKYLQNIKRG